MKFVGCEQHVKVFRRQGLCFRIPLYLPYPFTRVETFAMAETSPTLRQEEQVSSEDGRNGDGGAVA